VPILLMVFNSCSMFMLIIGYTSSVQPYNRLGYI